MPKKWKKLVGRLVEIRALDHYVRSRRIAPFHTWGRLVKLTPKKAVLCFWEWAERCDTSTNPQEYTTIATGAITSIHPLKRGKT